MIAIIGDFPNSYEISNGCFTGYIGDMLFELLGRGRVFRKDCCLKNIYDYNVGKYKKPSPEAIKNLQDYLLVKKPNVILALGPMVLEALTGYKKLDKWRGSIIPTPYGKVIPSYHPRDVLKMYEHKAILNLDIKKVIAEKDSPEYVAPKTDFITQPSFVETMSFLDELPETFSFDIETWGDRIRCLGLGISKERAICIPFMDSSCHSYWSFEQEREILFKLREIFKSPRHRTVAQNFPFDASFLEIEFGIEVTNLYMDTMIAQHCCYSELPKSLDFLTSIYTRHNYYADYNFHNDKSLWTYNCMDCIATFECMKKLELEIESLDVKQFYHKHAQPVMITLTKMGHRGLPVDESERTKMLVEAEKIVASRASVLPKELNYNSPKQLKNFLYTTLGMKPIRKQGRVSTDAESLDKLYVKYSQHREVIQTIRDIRKYSKLVSTYLKTPLDNGRLKCSFNATGTKNGRVSSSKTLSGSGGNLQNLPRGDFRRIFKAGPGKVILKGDLSQAEARAVAWFANIPSLIKNFQNPNFDVHKWNASIVFGKAMQDITKDERTLSKPIVHGTNYKMGPRTAAILAGISEREAREAMLSYYTALPELTLWHNRIENLVRTNHKLKTPFGRLRIFFGRCDNSSLRSAIAFLPQSTVGDIINQALYLIEQQMPDRIICQVHDEIVMEVFEDEVLQASKLMYEACEKPIYIQGVEDPLIIPLEIKIGPDWYNVKPLERN